MDKVKSYAVKLGGTALGVLVGLVVISSVLVMAAPYAPGIVAEVKKRTGLNPQA